MIVTVTAPQSKNLFLKVRPTNQMCDDFCYFTVAIVGLANSQRKTGNT